MTPNDSNLSDSPEEEPDNSSGNKTPVGDDVGAGSNGTPTVGTGSLSGLDLERRNLLTLLGGLSVAGGAIPSLADSVGAASSLPVTQLTASDPGEREFFGSALDLDKIGDTALIGAEEDGTNPDDAGAAYVFQFDPSTDTWTETQKLTADDRDKGDEFGVALALSQDGTKALISAPRDDEEAEESGAVYYFVVDINTGNWRQSQKFKPDNPDSNEKFGGDEAVAVDADASTAVIGAPGSSAVAYVFSNLHGQWTEQDTLLPGTSSDREDFGSSVAMANSGTRLAVGDPGAGAVYVYEFDSIDLWEQTQRLTGDDPGNDRFGSDVTFSNAGETLLIGAKQDSEEAIGAGAAYVFEFDTDMLEWSQIQKLTADDARFDGFFGDAVALADNGTTALVGANLDSEKGRFAGAAYLFEFENGTWTQEQKRTSIDPEPDDQYGTAVALSDDGDTSLIGAGGDSDEAPDAGAAYVTDPSVPIPSVALTNARPIQTVENTILVDPNGSDLRLEPPSPRDIVEGRSTTVLFNLRGSRNLDQIPAGETVEFEVTHEYADSATTSDTFELTKQEVQTLASASTDERTFFDSRPNKLPVFGNAKQLEEITIDVNSDINGDGTPEISGESTRLFDDPKRRVVDMRTIDIGFIEIADPEGGSNYGGSDGRISGNFDDMVSEMTEYLIKTFPISPGDIVTYKHGGVLDEKSALDLTPNLFLGGGELGDFKAAQSALEDEFPGVNFDGTVAVVPQGYPTFHDDGWDGKAYKSPDAAVAVVGNLSTDRLHHTVAQELAHFFLGETYPDELAMRQANGDVDHWHARTEPDSANNTPDPKFLESTGFDLSGSTYSLVGRNLESFMSYSADGDPVWADVHTYRNMLQSKMALKEVLEGLQDTVTGIGLLGSDDTVTFTNVLKKESGVRLSVSDSEVTMRVLDATGSVIDERKFPDRIEVSELTTDTNQSHTTEEDIFEFAVPFPEEAASLEAERDGTVTRLNPIERSLREAIARVPDAAFRRSPDDRREAFNDKLDSIDEMMEKNKYHQAKMKMEKDIRERVEEWIRDDYETGPLQPTKQELLDLVNDMIARLEKLG